MGWYPCCCNPEIGFEVLYWDFVARCSFAATLVPNIASDITLLTSDVKVLYCGVNGLVGCGDTLTFTSGAQWTAIASWLAAGGRLFVAGEFPGCLSSAGRTTINSFLTTIGSSMSLDTGTDVCNSPPAGTACYSGSGSAGAAKIVTSPTPLTVAYSAVGKVNGGTPIWLTDVESPLVGSDSGCGSSFPFIAIEKVGSGFVILCADSNVGGPCGAALNCDLFQRFFINSDSNLV